MGFIMRLEKSNIYQPTELCFRLGLNVAGANLAIFDDPDDPEAGLDIDFEIDKTIDETPNKSKITIWNVTPEIYTLLSEKGTGVELYGGFGRESLGLMFTGDIGNSTQAAGKITSTTNTGFLKIDQGKNNSGKNDIPTIITCYDAGVKYQDQFISRSYKGLISAEVIIRDCVNQMGIPYGRMDINNYPMVRDYVARGRCVTVLKDLTQRLGIKYNITNGIFNLVNPGQQVDTMGIVLNGDNSNRPELFEIRENGKKGWKIETSLLPFLNPATYSLCDFESLRGTYQVYRVHLSGNNYGTKGITEVYLE